MFTKEIDMILSNAKLRNNEAKYQDEKGNVIIIYHQTPIIKFNIDNTITLKTGGFWTRSTADHMNRYLPDGFRVFQEKFKWYLATNKTLLNFSEGMTFSVND